MYTYIKYCKIHIFTNIIKTSLVCVLTNMINYTLEKVCKTMLISLLSNV